MSTTEALRYLLYVGVAVAYVGAGVSLMQLVRVLRENRKKREKAKEGS